jgi:hypothetical protein
MAGAGTGKSVGGRPSERDESKRSAIAVRTTPTIKAALQEAAARSGRSLTQEIEQRLERSVELEQDLGGPEMLDMFRDIARSIAQFESEIGNWQTNYESFVLARAVIDRALDSFQPLPEGALSLHAEAGWVLESLRNLQAAMKKRWPEEPNLMQHDPISSGKFMDVEQIDRAITEYNIEPEDADVLRTYHATRAEAADVAERLRTFSIELQYHRRRAQLTVRSLFDSIDGITQQDRDLAEKGIDVVSELLGRKDP